MASAAAVSSCSPSFSWIKMASILFCSALVLLAIIPFGLSLKCYQCQSKADPVCAGDLPANPDPKHPGAKYLVDCNTEGNRSFIAPQYKDDPFVICRKQHQDVETKINIIRSCGVVEDKSRDCYSTANPPTKTYVCQCKTDGCNGATGVTTSLVASVLLPLVAMVMMR